MKNVPLIVGLVASVIFLFALYKVLQGVGIFSTKEDREEERDRENIINNEGLNTSKPDTTKPKLPEYNFGRVAAALASLFHTGQPNPAFPLYELRPSVAEMSAIKTLFSNIPTSTDLRNIAKQFENNFKRKLSTEITEKSYTKDVDELNKIIKKIK